MIQGPILQNSIPSGAVGILYAAKNPNKLNEPLFTIKTTYGENPPNFDIKVCKAISKLKYKPSSIRTCYGRFKEDSIQVINCTKFVLLLFVKTISGKLIILCTGN